MNNKVLNRNESLVYLGISNWEYQCCGRTPEIGQSVDWQISAHSAEGGYLLASAAAVDWDEDREIVRFPYGCASWDPALGDPANALVILWATWHDSQSWPRLRGVVEELYDVSATTRLNESGQVSQEPSSFQYRPTELATRWPDQPPSGEIGHRVITGSVVGLRVTSVVEPTGDDIEALRDARDRGRRTLHLFGPPDAFGAVIPSRGDRVTVDLADPRLGVDDTRGYAGVVTGIAGQVSRAVHSPDGFYTSFLNIDPEAPPADELFIQLLCDRMPN
ncbi:DUF6578 domain-containing protein [Mycobacteroides chelonae]|uniref:Uncharacterized protein n=1 Tax=Mycobacteroides chelonae TaxID=1774 RepID=A0A1S1MB49_MYCCH|nr:DUF6578 domain-containing protein [Mycobacteroides chelonae]OHU63175.1 hypothetical protein BKG85_17360 [Mycobacteroides chelonae]OHU79175.1 hypothetical protein BKG84_13045 [Mycobacteroides chelonae]QQG89819.1 hypothetical protein HBA99_23400 [Mycobacteroides chelonae]QQG94638.1 hypothetical protein HBA97_23400 [Mycobacteroides chelonae]